MSEQFTNKKEYEEKIKIDLLKMDRDFLNRVCDELVKILVQTIDPHDLYYVLLDGIEEEEIAEEIFSRIAKLAKKAIEQNVKEII
jgi:hypothetical protein